MRIAFAGSVVASVATCALDASGAQDLNSCLNNQDLPRVARVLGPEGRIRCDGATDGGQ